MTRTFVTKFSPQCVHLKQDDNNANRLLSLSLALKCYQCNRQAERALYVKQRINSAHSLCSQVLNANPMLNGHRSLFNNQPPQFTNP